MLSNELQIGKAGEHLVCCDIIYGKIKGGDLMCQDYKFNIIYLDP